MASAMPPLARSSMPCFLAMPETRRPPHRFAFKEYLPNESRKLVDSGIRPAGVVLHHPVHGRATISDNTPMSEKALRSCLDDGLTPEDWLRMLNARVFFWPDVKNVSSHLQACIRRGLERTVLIVDTLSLVRAHYDRVEISPINSGATMRAPARRGKLTFSPVGLYEYRTWQKLRGGRDTVKEVTVAGGVVNIGNHLVAYRDGRSFI